MNEFLNKVGAAFTPARRKVIYHVAFSACAILALHKVITAEEAQTYVEAVALILFGGQAELAAANVNGDE